MPLGISRRHRPLSPTAHVLGAVQPTWPASLVLLPTGGVKARPGRAHPLSDGPRRLEVRDRVVHQLRDDAGVHPEERRDRHF